MVCEGVLKLPLRSPGLSVRVKAVISPRLNESASLDKFQRHNQDISRHITYGLTCLSGRPRNITPLPCGNTREPTQESIGYVAIDPIAGVETCLLRPGELVWITPRSTPGKQYPFGGHLPGVRVAFQGFGSGLHPGMDSLRTLPRLVS